MKNYGLIGKKLGHSFSARYFNEKFEREGLDARYHLFEIPSADDLCSLIKEYPELCGLNVTIPYKRDVLPMLNSLTPAAAEIGAVNTIRVSHNADGSIRLDGHNTDACGFEEAIAPMIGMRKRALVLGQGGASRAVEYALKKLDVEITKVSRRESAETLTYEMLTPEVMASHDIIVNCTPLGMWPDIESCPAIPYHLVSPAYLCFDLVYNPEQTEFMKRCARQGAMVSNGLQMLRNQADAAWQFWNAKS